MTSRQRLFNRMEGNPIDRIPNTTIVMQFAAREGGVAYSKYVTDFKTLTECSLRVCERYKIDLLCAISDPMREAEGFGAKVVIPEDGVPYAEQPLLARLSDVATLAVPRIEDGARMLDRVRAVEYMKERAGREFAIAGWVEGAFAESCDLRGIDNFLTDIIMEEDEAAVRELLEKCFTLGRDFALAQIKAGADIIGIGDAVTSLISPDMYEAYALPYQKRLVEEIHKAGAKTKLHICGNVSQILELAVGTNSDIIDIDWMVNYKSAAKVCQMHNISASGNFDPVRILLQGSVEEVARAVRECTMDTCNNNLIAPGCETPPETPPENLLEVYNELARIGGNLGD